MSFLCRGFLDVWQKRFWVRNFGGISQFLRCKALNVNARVCLKNSLIRNFGRRCAISASSILDLALLSLRISSLNWRKIHLNLRIVPLETHSKPFDGLFELTNNVNGRTTYLHLRMVQFKTQYWNVLPHAPAAWECSFGKRIASCLKQVYQSEKQLDLTT